MEATEKRDLAPAEPTLKRSIGLVGIIGLGLSIVNGWVAMSSTIVIGLGQGGAPLILYGILGTTAVNVFLILTIAELASAYPTAGGQYVWSAILSKLSSSSGGRYPLSFVVGWATVYEWIVIVTAVAIICAQTVFGLVTTFNPAFAVQRWQVFLVLFLVNSNAALANILFTARMRGVGTFFLFFSTTVYVAILIACPAAAPAHQPSSFVWTHWQNAVGWDSKFVVAATGLVNPGFIWSGLDGAVHIAEDCLNPARVVPLALFSSIGIGFVTAFSFSVALLYSVQDIDAAAAAELPFLTIIVQATGSRVAGAVFMTCFLAVVSLMTNSIQMASSRLIWSFARDNALPFSAALSHVHPRLRVPVLPVIASWAGVTILGVLYIASSTVYNSIISCCIILQNFSFAIVAAQLLYRRRQFNPARWLNLGWLGWVANVVTIVWFLFSTVMWLFPLEPHPTASTMSESVRG
jgi:choline transport protein